MGLIISSNNIFISTSKAAIDKQVGNYIYQTLESSARYSTHMKISDKGKGGSNSFKQAFILNEKTDDNCDETTGFIQYKSPKSEQAINLYDNSFYGGRSIRYIFKKVGLDNKHLQITVEVYREGKRTYSRKGTIKCVNLGLLTSGVFANAIDDSGVTDYDLGNQDIYFSCDELLISGGKTSWAFEYKVQEFLKEYNEILEDYFDDLSAINNYVNDNLGKNADNERIQVQALSNLINSRTNSIFGDGKCYGESGAVSRRPKGDVDSSNFTDSSKVYNLRAYYQEKIYKLLGFTPTKMGYEKGSLSATQDLING